MDGSMFDGVGRLITLAVIIAVLAWLVGVVIGWLIFG
jgi:hypothetical protein